MLSGSTVIAAFVSVVCIAVASTASAANSSFCLSIFFFPFRNEIIIDLCKFDRVVV